MDGSPAASVKEAPERIRECNCHPWVERCAHLPDGRILRHYKVAARPSGYEPREVLGRYSDDASALQAFYEAEAALLGRAE